MIGWGTEDPIRLAPDWVFLFLFNILKFYPYLPYLYMGGGVFLTSRRGGKASQTRLAQA